MRATSISLWAAVGLTALCATTDANAGFSGHSFGMGFFPSMHRGHGAFMNRRFDHNRNFAFRRDFDRGRRFAYRRHFGYGYSGYYGSGYYGSDYYGSGASVSDPPAAGSIVIYAPAAGYSSPDPRPMSSGPKIIVIGAEREARPAGKLPIVIYGTTEGDQ